MNNSRPSSCLVRTRAVPRLLLALLAGFVSSTVSAAEPPAIAGFVPAAVGIGRETILQVRGQNLSGPCRLWTSLPTNSLPLPSRAEGTGDTVEFRLFPTADALPGIYSFRVGTSGGFSELQLFLLDDLPSIPEQPQHGSALAAQSLPLPCSIDGRIDDLSRDFYSFEAAAGQRLAIEVFARRLGSPLDPALFLSRFDGRELAYADDTEGLAGDCQLPYTFEESGVYVLEVRDIRYRGGDTHRYHLRLGDFPCVNAPLPLATPRGSSRSVHWSGIDVADVEPANVDLPADWPHDWYPVFCRRTGGQTRAFAMLAVSDTPEVSEAEPNDVSDQANSFDLGVGLNGRLDLPRDRDCFRWRAEKGEHVVFRGITRQAGSPADLTFRLLDPAGKVLATADDDEIDEGRIDHTFKETGDYVLEVADLHRRGGPAFPYRIETRRGKIPFELSAGVDVANVPTNGVAIIPVAVKRRNYDGDIRLRVEGLSSEFHANETWIGRGMTNGVVAIEATSGPTEETQPRDEFPRPLTITGVALVDGVEVSRVATTVDLFKARWTTPLFVAPAARSALVVASTQPLPCSLSIDPSEIRLQPGSQVEITVTAKRDSGARGPIELALAPESDSLPAEVKLPLQTIPADANSVQLRLSAGKASVGTFSVALRGTLNGGDGATIVWSPPLTCRIAAE